MVLIGRVFAAALILFFSACILTQKSSAETTQNGILNAVNTLRTSHGLPKLALHPALERAAREQSVLMARKGRMSHKVGFRHSFSARLKRAGYRGLAAENIAKGQTSLQRVLEAWMNSRGHRRNMLHPRMRYFGLSVAKSRGKNYWTMVLGG